MSPREADCMTREARKALKTWLREMGFTGSVNYTCVECGEAINLDHRRWKNLQKLDISKLICENCYMKRVNEINEASRC